MYNHIPTPPISYFDLGFTRISIYALCILIGGIVAFFISLYRSRNLELNCGESKKNTQTNFQTFLNIAICVMLGGVIGARLYYIITVPKTYLTDPLSIFAINQGGLGIMGGIIGGSLAVIVYCRLGRIDIKKIAWCIVPGIPFAQCIGRLGNWFNAELYGVPTDLPWGLDISRGSYIADEFYHPTFLYEMLWNIFVGIILLIVFRKFDSNIFSTTYIVMPTYLSLYLFGRIFIETLRTDFSEYFLGLRINLWCALFLLIGAIIWYGIIFMLKRTRFK